MPLPLISYFIDCISNSFLHFSVEIHKQQKNEENELNSSSSTSTAILKLNINLLSLLVEGHLNYISLGSISLYFNLPHPLSIR